MRRSHLFTIITFGAGILALVFLFSGMIPWPCSGPVGQLRGETPVGSPAITTSPATVTSITLAPPASAPAEKSTTLSIPITVASGPAVRNPYTISTTALEQQVHELINQKRTEMGLDALAFDPALADIARKHSEDMAARNYFDHVNLAGQNPTARGTAAGYTCRKNYGSYYTYGIAENIFQNNLYSSVTYYSNRDTEYDWNPPEKIAQITVSGWMNSSGHRENILTPTFDREGIGIAIAADDKVYITEDFC